MIPIIVIEQKKIVPALVLNFKRYAHFWGVIFIVLLITEIPYIPFILIRSARLDEILSVKLPEVSGIFLVVSVLLLLVIDIFQYTAITLCYLFKKEKFMKKTIIVLPVILLLIYVIFTAIDRSDYVIEKKIWNIHRQINILASQGKAAPANQLENMAVKVKHLIHEYPHSDLRSRMYMQLAQIYVFTKDFDKARTYYQMVLDKFPEQQPASALKLWSQLVRHFWPKTGGMIRLLITNYTLKNILIAC